ncbi:hypothetical protein ACQPZF_26435 [Actinosynnema sp. CS-041913]|uniref:hypothetical protein n=1 Tax=Actinosynnema sp. CS-041913 TaxID=3239917 RepID=UPI003D8F1F22
MTQVRSVSVISSSTKANGRPAAQASSGRVFQCSPIRSSSRSVSQGSGQATTARCGSPILGAMDSLASSAQLVAHTRSQSSDARRGPCAGLILTSSGFASSARRSGPVS